MTDRPLTPEQVASLAAQVRQAIAAARTTPTTPRREPEPLTEEPARLEQVRALIPQEATE